METKLTDKHHQSIIPKFPLQIGFTLMELMITVAFKLPTRINQDRRAALGLVHKGAGAAS